MHLLLEQWRFLAVKREELEFVSYPVHICLSAVALLNFRPAHMFGFPDASNGPTIYQQWSIVPFNPLQSRHPMVMMMMLLTDDTHRTITLVKSHDRAACFCRRWRTCMHCIAWYYLLSQKSATEREREKDQPELPVCVCMLERWWGCGPCLYCEERTSLETICVHPVL